MKYIVTPAAFAASIARDERPTVITALARFEGWRKSELQKRANSDRRDKGLPTPGRIPYGNLWLPTELSS